MKCHESEVELRLHLLDKTLTPVFTHQIFNNRADREDHDAQEQQQEKEQALEEKKEKVNEENSSPPKGRKVSFAPPEPTTTTTTKTTSDIPTAEVVSVDACLEPSCQTCRVHLTSNEASGESTIKIQELEKDMLDRVSRALPPIVQVSYTRIRKQENKEEQKETAGKDEPSVESKKRPRESTITKTLPDPNAKQPEHSGFLTQPMGQTLTTLERSPNSHKRERFILTLAQGSNPQVAAYHQRIQHLALWWIESAEVVNVSSHADGGAWQILYLFRQHENVNDNIHMNQEQGVDSDKMTNTKKPKVPPASTAAAPPPTNSPSKTKRSNSHYYSLAGYFSLYLFHAPFYKPLPGHILRICQALILPPYQRCGLGQDMYHAVYDYVANANANANSTGIKKVVQVNVEDPAVEFGVLRKMVDCQRLMRNVQQQQQQQDSAECKDNCKESQTDKQHGEKDEAWLPAMYTIQPQSSPAPSQDPKTLFPPLPEKVALQAATKAQITSAQMHMAYELYKLSVLDQLVHKHPRSLSEATTTEQVQKEQAEAMEKQYRLMVKRRLLLSHSEQFVQADCIPPKPVSAERRKEILAGLYEKVMKDYRVIVKLPSKT